MVTSLRSSALRISLISSSCGADDEACTVIRMMRLRDYPGIAPGAWPPQPGGAFGPCQAFPTDERVLVTKVFPVINELVTFTCEFQGSQPTCDLRTTDAGMAEELARLLKRHVGKTLEKFGEFPLDC
jgi:hypothetical protein